uniref:INSM transcriptional repressor 2 n=1 Tax=Callorhinchus milii TaxID=7868 RepID=A0A4W3H0K6_CALMI
MPRGFLVKRNKKSSPVSYRVRTEEKADYRHLRDVHPPSPAVPAAGQGDPRVQAAAPRRGGPEPRNDGLAAPHSPAPPGGAEQPVHPFSDRCLDSPASGESFPVGASLNPRERLLLHPPFSAVSSSSQRGAAAEQSQRKSKSPATAATITAGKKPGEADWESEENTGSKRGGGGGGGESPPGAVQHLDSSGESPVSPGLSAADGGELFQCCYCSKRFRRQAYLKRHLTAHQAARRTVSPCLPFPCQLCGAPLPSAEVRDKHLVWHAVGRGEAALLGPGAGDRCAEGDPSGGEQAAQIYPCKHCPSTFVSSPGLTRHINKCHPSENRQVLLLQIPLRPGC